MNIKDAIIQANKKGRGITRRSYGTHPRMLLPTNTASCILIVPFEDNQFKTKRWNPRMEDLVADDWYVYG